MMSSKNSLFIKSSKKIFNKFWNNEFLMRIWLNKLLKSKIKDCSHKTDSINLSKIFPRFHEDSTQALKLMHVTNNNQKIKIKNVQTDLIDRAVEFGYLSWPRKILSHIIDKDILDVGCGTGLHAIGYIVCGVKSYTGIDPKIDVNSDRGKNVRTRDWQNFGWTPNAIMEQLQNVDYISGTFEDMAPENTFDIAVLHNVTEHLLQIEDVFIGIVNCLRPNGKILFNHHNFFCWNGHHKKPKTVQEIDENNAEQMKYIDWRHLQAVNRKDDELKNKLNLIRMKDLKEIVEKYFSITIWDEIPSKPDTGLDRLTNDILEKYPQYDRHEFITQNVFCVGTLK